MYPPLKRYGITDPYGMRDGVLHRGIDIPCPTGTPLPSPIDGHIAYEGRIPAAAPGYVDEIICIIQGKGEFIVMGHLSETLVNSGQRVKKGDIVAHSGNTGYSTGPHLHIELATGTKDPNKGILAYPSKDITPLLRSYGSEEAPEDMTIIVRPISQLNVHLKKGIPMYDIETGKELHNSGKYMELTQITNLVRGKKYYIPKDRAEKGQVYGFWDVDVRDNAEKIHDTQHDPRPKPGLSAQDKQDLELGRQFRELIKEVK